MGDLQQKRDAEIQLIKDIASRCKTAVITGPAAARWLDLSTKTWVTKVDLALPGNSRTWGDKDPRKVYHGGLLRAAEFVEHNGIRTATAIRAMFDSFRYYGPIEALVQIESARFKHEHLTTDYLLEKTETLTRARGIKAFRELICYSADTSASALETIVRDAILRAIAQGRLTGGGDHRVPSGVPHHRGRWVAHRRLGRRAHQRVYRARGGRVGEEQRGVRGCSRSFTT